MERYHRRCSPDYGPVILTDELHVGYVTNGVHLPTWLGPEWKKLYEKTFGNDCFTRQEDRKMWDKIKLVPDRDIWDLKSEERESLINYIKERLADGFNHDDG